MKRFTHTPLSISGLTTASNITADSSVCVSETFKLYKWMFQFNLDYQVRFAGLKRAEKFHAPRKQFTAISRQLPANLPYFIGSVKVLTAAAGDASTYFVLERARGWRAI